MEIKVIYEDSEVLVINKPAGLLVHADGSSGADTVVSWIMHNYSELTGVGEAQVLKDGSEIERPGIVHRLDRDTSGIMLIAKTEKSFQNLKVQFKEREIKKAYLAIVRGKFKTDDESGEVNKSIGRSPADFRRWSAQPGARGKLRAASTEYHVLEQINDYALVFLAPKSGRTHQLRVHMKAIHRPIICDALYSPNTPCPKSLSRHALHARAITWKNLAGITLQQTADLPDDFKNALEELNFKYHS